MKKDSRIRPDTEKEWMEAIIRKDKEAFNLLSRKYRQTVFRIALRMTGDAEEAEDIAQDVFVKIWLEAGKFDARFSLSTWIYRITNNLCIDRLRRAKWMKAFSFLGFPGSSRTQASRQADFHPGQGNERQSESPEEQWIAGESWRVFEKISQGLSPKQKSVFLLKEIEGLSTEETAFITGLNPEQIKSNLYWARQSIRKRFKQYYEGRSSGPEEPEQGPASKKKPGSRNR